MPRALSAFALVALLLVGFAATSAVAGPVEDGNKALDAKDWPTAAEAFRKALAKTPKQPDAAVGLARAVIGGWMTDAFVGTEETLLETAEAHPARRDVRLALGDLYIASAKSKADNPQAMKFILEDAKTTFQTLLEEDATDEKAAVGLARALYETADFEGAIATLDAFLEKAKGAGAAWFWKGQAYYLQALDAYRNAGQLDENAKSLFGKAAGAYMTATKLDPKDFEAWMQLGYASQYVGDTPGAREAYEKAMDLDPRSLAPLKGIDALFYYTRDKYPAALKDLAKAHPDNVALQYYIGYDALTRKQYDEALRAFDTYAAKAMVPGGAYVHMATAYEGKGDAKRAQQYYRKALEFNPDDATAADGIDRALRNEYLSQASASPKNALAMASAYQELFDLAPRNAWVRNNVAFVLREALTPHQGQGTWKPVLDACVKIYEEASQIVQQQIAGGVSQTPYPTRHALAGVFNDTGLMYQYYDAIRDFEKAEDYYIRALDLTDDGYGDAFDNLQKIYKAEERWDDLRELASSAAENLKQADGTPNATGRAHARGILQQVANR